MNIFLSFFFKIVSTYLFKSSSNNGYFSKSTIGLITYNYYSCYKKRKNLDKIINLKIKFIKLYILSYSFIIIYKNMN